MVFKKIVLVHVSPIAFVQPICDIVPLNELSVDDDYHQTGGGGGGGGRYTTILCTVVVWRQQQQRQQAAAPIISFHFFSANVK